MDRHSAYAQAQSLTAAATGVAIDFEDAVIPVLVNGWLASYRTVEPAAEIVRVDTKGHSYLFDVTNARLVVAWSVIAARERRARDASRMRRYPQPFGNRYHRGHAIAHTMGGGEEINLVPQLGSINIGAFRTLERRALQHEGALYFTFWIYGASLQQAPIGVEQGLLVPGEAGEIAIHDNGQPEI